MEARVLQAAARTLREDESAVRVGRVANEYFTAWTLWRATTLALPPATVSLASHERAGVQLIELGDGLSTLTALEPVVLKSPDEAIRYARFFIGLCDAALQVIESIEEIPGVADADRERWRSAVTPPSAVKQGLEYRVDLCASQLGDLIHGRLVIDARGAIVPNLEIVASGISCFTELT